MKPRTEEHNLHGTGAVDCDVYDMPGRGWSAITDVPCPVEGCNQTVLWYEAGYVPGYRVCMAPVDGQPDHFDPESIKHRFLGYPDGPKLVRDRVLEDDDD